LKVLGFWHQSLDIDWKGMRVPSIIKKKRILDDLCMVCEYVCVRGSPGSLIWHLLREGGAVLCSFIDWFLLLLVARCLLACLLGLSRVSCLA